jgi:hypothetical protein
MPVSNADMCLPIPASRAGFLGLRRHAIYPDGALSFVSPV